MRKDEKYVFVTDYKQRHAQAIIYSLRKSGYKIITITDDRYVKCKKYNVDIFYHTDSNDISYGDLVAFLRTYNCQFIVPISIKYCKYFSLNKRKFLDEGFRLLIADYELWFRFYNKDQTALFATSIGIPLPKTIRINKETVYEDINKLKTSFPIVIKSAEEGGARFVRYANCDSDVQNIINFYEKEKSDIFTSGVIAQQYIKGKSCAYFALADNGKVLAEFGHIRCRENPPTGGISTCCESFYHPKLFNYGTKIIEQSGYSGVIMIEFKYVDNEDEFYLIEINPKFWGSILLPIVAGVDFPSLYIQYLEHKSLPQIKFNHNIRIQFFISDINRMLKFKRDYVAVFKDLFSGRVKKDFNYFGLCNYVRYYFR